MRRFVGTILLALGWFLAVVLTILAVSAAVLGASSHDHPWRAQWEREATSAGAGRLCAVRSQEGSLVIDWVEGWPGWTMLGIDMSVAPEVVGPLTPGRQPALKGLREFWGVRVFEGRPSVSVIYSPRFEQYGSSGGGAFVGSMRQAPADYKATVIVVPWARAAWTAGAPAALWFGTIGLRALLRRRRSRRRAMAGRCVGCGYDLRESPAGCPECGRGRA